MPDTNVVRRGGMAFKNQVPVIDTNVNGGPPIGVADFETLPESVVAVREGGSGVEGVMPRAGGDLGGMGEIVLEGAEGVHTADFVGGKAKGPLVRPSRR